MWFAGHEWELFLDIIAFAIISMILFAMFGMCANANSKSKNRYERKW